MRSELYRPKLTPPAGDGYKPMSGSRAPWRQSLSMMPYQPAVNAEYMLSHSRTLSLQLYARNRRSSIPLLAILNIISIDYMMIAWTVHDSDLRRDSIMSVSY